MRLWVGRLQGEGTEWVLVWGDTREHAIETLEQDLGDVDAESVHPVRGSGYLVFRSIVRATPVADAIELEPMRAENLVIYDPETEEWILART